MTRSQGAAPGRAEPPAAAITTADLAHVGRGTPAGEWFRRYWLAISRSSDLGDLPHAVRVLGEDLVLFRDGQGRPGLLGLHCPHRDTSLEYGDVESRGLRCCYHGWLFDVEGYCLEQPAEPRGSTFHQKVRHLWYPVREQGGLVFAYLGPDRESPPPLPRYAPLQDDRGGQRNVEPVRHHEYNWFNFFENAADPTHISVLHRYSGYGAGSWGSRFFDYEDIPDFEPVEVDYGLKIVLTKPGPRPGTEFVDTMSAALPSILQIGDTELVHAGVDDADTLEKGTNNEHILFLTPNDDDHFMVFTADHYTGPVPDFFEQLEARRATEQPRTELIAPGEHRPLAPYRGSVRREDTVAQKTQRDVSQRPTERLGTADRGVIKLRRILVDEIAGVLAGRTPRGVLSPEEGDRLVSFDSFVGVRARPSDQESRAAGSRQLAGSRQ